MSAHRTNVPRVELGEGDVAWMLVNRDAGDRSVSGKSSTLEGCARVRVVSSRGSIFTVEVEATNAPCFMVGRRYDVDRFELYAKKDAREHAAFGALVRCYWPEIRTRRSEQKPVTHKAALELGWTRVDAKPWRSKLCARWEHVDGWKLEHCGHQTALHPWLLLDASGRMHGTGSTKGNPDFGTAWDTLRDAMEYVALATFRRAS